MVIKSLSFLVLLEVHEVDLLDLEVEVADPVVKVLHHVHFDFVELVDAWVHIAEQEGHFELTLIQLEVRVEQWEDAPAHDVVLRHDIRLQQHQFELQAIRSLELRRNQHWNDVLDLEVLIKETSVEARVVRCRPVQVKSDVLCRVDRNVELHIGSLHLRLVQGPSSINLSLDIIRFEEAHASGVGPHVRLLTRGIFGDDLAVLRIQKLTFLQTEFAQVTRYKTVLFLGAPNFHFDPVTADSVKSMNNDQKVAAADFVLEAAGDLDLDQDCLRELLLDLDDLLDKFGALRVQLRVDFVDRLLNLLAVENQGSVAAHDHILLLLHTLDERLDGGLEAFFEHLFLHLELLLGAGLLPSDKIIQVFLSLGQVRNGAAVLVDDKLLLTFNELVVCLLPGFLVFLLLFGLLLQFFLRDGHDL